MNLTDEQKNAVIYDDGNAVVIACPGSGKTRTLIARLIHCLEKVKDTPRKIACITYTNAAVQEIETRVRRSFHGDSDRFQVSTIHAFCLNNILKNFYWLLDDFTNGFQILPNDSEEYIEIVSDIADRYSLSDYDRDNSFEQIGRAPDGTPLLAGDIPEEVAYDYWSELVARGYIDFSGILYYSTLLVRDNAFIAKALSAKFHTILLDEFQDTTEVQAQLLWEVFQVGLTEFMLVGDPEQSIYAFAGAHPELLRQFAGDIQAKEFHLSGNFRSSQRVIDCAEQIIPRIPPMCMANPENDYPEMPEIHGASNPFDAITDYFLPAIADLGIEPNEAAILSPSWYDLYPLGKKLREYGVPIIGPGARPYKRNHLFGRIAEPISEYLGNPSTKKVYRIEKELHLLITDLESYTRLANNSYASKRIVHLLLQKGSEIADQYEGAKDWLRASAQSFADILVQEQVLSSGSGKLLTESVEDILSDIVKNKVDVENMTVADLGLIANPEGSIKLLTMHKAKGREFDAVALISMHDGQIPYHNYYNPLSDNRLEESRRQFYVSATRARRLLMMFYNEGGNKPPSRFLDNLGQYRTN